MTPIDSIRDGARRYLESHSDEIGRFIVDALTAWIKDRRKARAAIAAANELMEKEFEEAIRKMREGQTP